MYLEMLQQRYGAELEKQAMEKQALNPMQLVQMGRRFAAKGKMDRFGQLIAKRNNAIKNTNAFAKRQAAYNKLSDKAWQEQGWLGHTKGPVNRQYQGAERRIRQQFMNQDNLQNLSWDDPDTFKYMVRFPSPMGTVRPDILAGWSKKLRDMGM